MTRKRRAILFPLLGLLIISLSTFVYVKSVMAATNCWTGGGVTENWSETANWSLGVAPGVSGNTTNLATFGSASCASGLTKNVTIDTNIDLSGSGGGILISATTNAYTGIITQGTSTITIGSGNYSQAGGTFTGGSGTITINGSYSLTGGTFTSSSDTTTGMSITTNLTISGNPTFNHNSGIITINGSNVQSQAIASSGVTFNKVVINKGVCGNATLTINSGSILPLGDSPTVTACNIALSGTLSGTGTLTQDGNGATTLSSGAVFSGFSGFDINASLTISGATVDFSSYTTFNLGQDFTFTSGSFTAPPTFTIDGGSTTFQTISSSGVTFNKVVISKGACGYATLTISSGSVLPLGDSPTVTACNIALSGTLSGTGTLTNNAATTINSSAALSGFSGLTQAASLTLASNFTVPSFTLTSGTVANPASAYTLSVTGNFTQNANTAFGGGNLTVAMTGSGNQTYTRSTGTFVSAFTVNKTGGTATLASSLNTGTTSTGQACNITSGTLDLAGNALVCASLTVGSGGNLQWRGSETITLTSPTTPTLNSGSTVTFTGTSGTNSYTIPTTWGNFSNLTINAPTGTNTFNLGADLVAGKNLTITAGTFDPTATPYNLTIGGNLTNNGTITARSNTVTFNDNTQNSIITGSASTAITFYNLTAVTASKILKFGAGKTFRINGLFTVTGTAKNQINLSSATPMTQWTINLQGTSAITYAFVQDSACDGTSLSIALDGTSRNGGNNGTCWSGYPVSKNVRIQGGDRIQGTIRIGAN